MAAAGLVTFAFVSRHPSAHLQPKIMLQWLTFMPQLETLLIVFLSPVSSRDVERQLMHTPHVILPNLRWLLFRGVKSYLEALVCRITTPRLEKLIVHFFEQLMFSVPCLLQFMNTAENLRFDSAKIRFSRNGVQMRMYLREGAEVYALLNICCCHLDWQISSMTQVFDSLTRLFSRVEHLTIEHRVHNRSTEEHNEVDRAEWCKLLRSFSNVKTFCVSDGLVKEFSRCLRLGADNEELLELLPELQELTYSGSGDTIDAFKLFMQARRNAGRPVTLTFVDKGPSVPPTNSDQARCLLDIWTRSPYCHPPICRTA